MRKLLVALLLPIGLSAAPKEVAVVRPVEFEITDHEDFTGHIDASRSVEIRSRTAGYLQKVLFKEGSNVRKGDILFQLDDRNQRAKFDQAKAELLQAEAKLKLAEAELQRAKQLLQLKSISKEEFEKIVAETEAAKATIAAVRAKLELSKLNLDATQIYSPIAGRIGRRLVDEGNFLKGEGDTLLASVVVTDPLYVYFDISERTLLRLTRKLREANENELAVEVRFAANEKELYSAKLNFVDNKVNTTSGMMTARAVLANPKGDLVPGLFAKVRVIMGPSRKVLTIPESAILDGKVLVVESKNVLAERELQLGKLDNGRRLIEGGLKAEEKIVAQPRGFKPGDEVVPVQSKATPSEKPGVNSLLPQAPSHLPGNGLVLIVSATFPGASANEVEQVVAAPIIEQLRGLEGVTHQFVECTDGEVRITLGFKKNTDLNKAMVLTQNRLALAAPLMPEAVRQPGITVKKRPVFLLSVALLALDDSRDRRFLAGYADLQLRHELARATGVAEVAFLGNSGPSEQLHLKIDRERLARFGLTASEVSAVANEQLAGVRRQIDPDQLGNVAVKVTNGGQTIRLKDVAKIETVSAHSSTTKLDGKECVILTVSRAVDSDSANTMKSVRERVEILKKVLPAGLELRVVEE